MNYGRAFEDWWVKNKLGYSSILTKKDCYDVWQYQQKRHEKLQANNEKLEERYIEAVNDLAKHKRKLKNCVCPNCGFGFEQALEG